MRVFTLLDKILCCNCTLIELNYNNYDPFDAFAMLYYYSHAN